MNRFIKILVVDDEPLNLDLIGEYFDGGNYNPIYADDGDTALIELEKHHDVDVIVLDRMMPRMDGMTFLKKIKSEKRYSEIPVIMQTAANSPQQIAEGIESGVYYYLSKPYTKNVFLSIVQAAYDDMNSKLEIKKHLKEYGRAMSMITSGDFVFSTPEQARSLAILIGSCAAQSESIVLGLTELMLNSVEHGNLGFSYDDKKALKIQGGWENEIQKRLKFTEYAQKSVQVNVSNNDGNVNVKIIDEGKGFDWHKFEAVDPSRLMDPNGRGITMCLACGFEKIEYKGIGNHVECVFKVV